MATRDLPFPTNMAQPWGVYTVYLQPTSVFVGVLFVYWKMTNDRELVALQTAGVSPLAIARPALLVAFGATIVGYTLTLYLLPASYRAFASFEERIHSDFGEILLPEGVFSNVLDSSSCTSTTRKGARSSWEYCLAAPTSVEILVVESSISFIRISVSTV